MSENNNCNHKFMTFGIDGGEMTDKSKLWQTNEYTHHAEHSQWDGRKYFTLCDHKGVVILPHIYDSKRETIDMIVDAHNKCFAEPSNPPLTEEQIRAMVGMPVWVEFDEPKERGYKVIYAIKDYTDSDEKDHDVHYITVKFTDCCVADICDINHPYFTDRIYAHEPEATNE